MTYQEAMARLDGAKTLGSKLGLDTMVRLMAKLGDPQKKLKFIHVAGTNGKGSTAAYLSAMLHAAGYRTGLYISPYVQRFEERIQVDGAHITQAGVAEAMTKAAAAADELIAGGFQAPTVFEYVTAIGFLHFLEQGCDVVVLEVGLGGRLDATNVIDAPLLAVMTQIGLDHTELLGNTIAEIASEKAGIIKTGSRVVVCAQEEPVMRVFSERCRALGCQMRTADGEKAALNAMTVDGLDFDFEGYRSLRTCLTGLHQIKNAVTALRAAEALAELGFRLDETSIREGLFRARCIGRLEPLCRDPLFLVDGAHNVQGVGALRDSLMALFPGRKLIFIVGMLADKEYRQSVGQMLPLAEAFYTISPDSPRALPAEELAREIARMGSVPVSAQPTATAAIEAALSRGGRDALYCAFGSLYQIAGIRSFWKEKK